MSADSTGSESKTLNGWYELFSRGARDWLRHNEKIREAVRAHLPQIVAGADVINDGARTVRVPVRMLEHYRFRCCRPASRRGSVRERRSPATCSGRPTRPAVPARRARAARTAAASSSCSSSRSTTSSTGCGRTCSCPTCKPRVGASGGSGMEARGLGPARRALAARSSPLAQGVGQAPRAASRTHRRSPTRTCASGSSRGAASRHCARPCSSCSMSRAACPTATASWPRRSSSGSLRACGASTRRSTSCSSRTRPRPGNSTSRTSSR